MVEKERQEKEEIKESFCGACIVGVAALAGIGTAGSSKGIKNKEKKKLLFWIGVSVTILSILVLLYLIFVKKCNECL